MLFLINIQLLDQNNENEWNMVLDIVKTDKIFFGIADYDNPRLHFMHESNTLVLLSSNYNTYVSYKLKICQNWNE